MGESLVKNGSGSYPAEVEQALQRLADDIVHMEQHGLHPQPDVPEPCVPEQQPDYGLNLQPPSLYVSSPLKPENLNLASTANRNLLLLSVGSVHHRPAGQNSLMVLAEVWPGSVRFEDLCREARKRLSPLLANDGPTYERDVNVLGRMGLQFLTSVVDRLIEIRPHMLPVSKDGGDKPKAPAVTRYQATHGKSATNLKHETGNLGEFERNLLLRCDGSRTRAELLEVMYSLLQQGLLNINVDGQVVTDPVKIRQMLEPAFHEALQKFAQFSYLT